MNRDFLVTVAIVVTMTAVYAGILVAVLPIGGIEVSALVLPGK